MRYLKLTICIAAICAYDIADGTDEKLQTFGSVPAVFQAVLTGDASKLKQILREGADPNERTHWGMAPLHQAMFERFEISRILLDAGADVNIHSGDHRFMPSNRWTPLFYAVTRNRVDLVAELIKHGANVNVSDSAGQPPLFYAVATRHKEIAEMLRGAGAEPLADAPNPVANRSPAYYPHGPTGIEVQLPGLYQAILAHERSRVETLLKNGADPNEKAAGIGWFPLHFAMQSELAICRLLLEYGADPNARIAQNAKGQSNGWTPIFYAVYRGRDDLIIELLRHGANVNIVDAMGHSPLWYAKDGKKDMVARILESAGAGNN